MDEPSPGAGAAAADATPTVVGTAARAPAAGATLSRDPVVVAAAPAALTEGWSELGRYALVEELARGGGGRIAVAIDRKLHRKVAVKRPLDRSGAERLEREALVLARLEHPAIVPIHDVGEDAAGAPYYAMKLLGGQTLGDRMRAAASFEQRLGLLAVVTAVADAVAYAHSQRVIHRDLKPSNVLVGEFGEVALIDWGLGKLLAAPADAPAPWPTPVAAGATAELTGVGGLVGTPAYMAPEQAAGGDVDERADVYALGATLYQVLTGAAPYGERDADATLAALRAGPPPPIGAREPRVPDDLAAIVAKAMAREPGARYRDGRALADDLRRYQTGRLVAAHRYRWSTRAWRWLRTRRSAVALATAALAVATTALVLARRPPARPDPCRAVAAIVDDAWNPTVEAAGARAFAATGVGYAPAAWRRAARALGAHARQLATMREAACRATHDRRDQPAEVLALRTRCLDLRQDELASVAGMFARADAAVVERSEPLLATLGRVDDCADRARLTDVVPLPAEPARRAAVEALQRELPRLAQLDAVGKLETQPWRVVLPALRALLTGYPPLTARFLGRLAALTRDEALAERMLWMSVANADRAHDDLARGLALTKLINLAINRAEQPARASALIEQALAVAERTGDADLQSDAYIFRSQVAQQLGDRAGALADAERAVAVATAGPDGNLAHARYNLGAAYVDAGRAADADRVLAEVVAALRRDYGGDDHPDVGRALANQAGARFYLGDVAGALGLMREAEASLARTQPADGRELLELRANVAAMREADGQADQARADLEALVPALERVFGHDASTTVNAIENLGAFREHRGELPAALAYYRDALARTTRRAPDTAAVAELRRSIGSILTQQGRPRAAIPELEAALAIYERLDSLDAIEAIDARADLGRCRVDTGAARAAIDDLELALATYDVTDGQELARGLYRTALAQAYWATGQRARASTVAADARRRLIALGADGADGVAELDAWERARR
ncbi:MAG: tetratricopeptide repeat protein [Myxococcales bacterium]|nr:tetratricopeptide repeat protein [Myxococcales bacterium]